MSEIGEQLVQGFEEFANDLKNGEPVKVTQFEVRQDGTAKRTTRDFAEVIRAKLAKDPELAARVEEAHQEAMEEVAEYEREMSVPSNAQLRKLAATRKPPQEWYDEDQQLPPE